MSVHQVPEATIARLPGYLRVLESLAARGVGRVSSTELAEAAGVQSALLRRDLSHLGSYGTRGVGYEVPLLAREIRDQVGTTTVRRVVLVGVGNMGRALARHLRHLDPDFELVALVDHDPAVVGSTVAGLAVHDAHRMTEVVAGTGATIGIIATPATAAQAVCDQLCAAGIRGVLNFAPTGLVMPQGVGLRSVDLSQELHILAFHEARRPAGDPPEENRP